jgi:anti-sigma regulatory factor (Ser/Thr protein kinase)
MYEPVAGGNSLRLRCPAQSRYVAPVRHALGAFLRALEYERQALDDITTAAGEALANIVEHAYAMSAPSGERYLELRAKVDPSGRLSVDVCDGGSFIERGPLPQRGFGLRIIRAIAAQLTIDTSAGTRVHMTFNPKR